MSGLPLLGQEDLDADQKMLWDYILKGPRAASLSGPIKYLPGPFNPWMQIPSFGKLAAALREPLGLASRFCDFAEAADIATTDRPASFAKPRRENLPGIGSPSGS